MDCEWKLDIIRTNKMVSRGVAGVTDRDGKAKG
jgi:hypothetical protein